jgi:hypothetical protein
MFVPKAKSKSHSKTGRKNKEFLKKSIKLTRTEKNILIEEEVINDPFNKITHKSTLRLI